MLVCLGGEVKILCYILHEPSQTPPPQTEREGLKKYGILIKRKKALTILNISM